MATQSQNLAAAPRPGGGAPQVRRVVTPAQQGTLAVSDVSTATSVSRVRTPAQENAETEDRATAAILSVPGVARLSGTDAAAFLTAASRMTPQAGDTRAQGRASVRGGAVAASVVIDGSRSIPAIERDIRARIAEQWDGRLDLVFSDIELPGEEPDTESDATSAEESGSGDGR
ncbi:hypothetical protein [Dietzia sp.]|uniref:hypothetical protein n=1 Tax=Dietzia sp. TaxID=1871616 RepID=UPI002FDA826F